jgi:beta-glucanase (GH16 family)
MRMSDRRGARRALPALAAALALGCGLMPPEEQATPQDEGGGSGDRADLPPPGYTLVLEDQFSGTRLDPSVWTALSAPRLDAVSTPAAIQVGDGLLTVTTFTQGGRHFTGFVNTEGKFEARYGYFEARIRFNSQPGSWCAFWLAAPTIGKPIGDPARAGGEIDVVEHRVTDQGGWDELRDMVAVALNWDGYDSNRKNVGRVVALPDGSRVQGEWHTYSVLWTPTGYTFYVDGRSLWTTDAALSHRAQDVQLTCEVEDGSWAGFVPAGGYGPLATSDARMEVDWVRGWQAP